mgnify:FL=1
MTAVKECLSERKKEIGILGICILLFIAAACGKSALEKWQEQYDLGQQYLLEENYEEAIVAFTAAIESDPKQADAYLGRGDAYILSGETEENLMQALADYRQVLEMDEANASAYLGVADVYIRQGEYEAALEVLNEGLEKIRENDEIVAKIEEIKSGNITDSSGNTRRMSSYDSSGVLRWYHEYTYDASGKQISATSYDSSGNQTGHVDIQYDKNGRRIVDFIIYTDVIGEVTKCVREYNESGQLIRNEYYDPQGILYVWHIIQYDSNGRCVRSESYNAEGTLTGVDEYEYDTERMITRKNTYNGAGSLLWFHISEYDSYGKLIRDSNYFPDGQLNGYQAYDCFLLGTL